VPRTRNLLPRNSRSELLRVHRMWEVLTDGFGSCSDAISAEAAGLLVPGSANW
jgi:hypothetical protein